MSASIHRSGPGISLRVVLLASAASLAACKSVEMPKVPSVTPYRMVIQQGNFISQEMVSQLKPGMTREQVRFVLGTPLLADIFHADRWDYVFFRELPDGKREQRNLSIIFENNRLARVMGDLLPAEGAAESSGFAPQVKPEVPPKTAAKPPAEPEKAAAKPPAEADKAAAQAPKDAAVETQPAAAPKEDEKKPEQEPKERGFFGRMLEKIGL